MKVHGPVRRRTGNRPFDTWLDYQLPTIAFRVAIYVFAFPGFVLVAGGLVAVFISLARVLS